MNKKAYLNILILAAAAYAIFAFSRTICRAELEIDYHTSDIGQMEITCHRSTNDLRPRKVTSEIWADKHRATFPLRNSPLTEVWLSFPTAPPSNLTIHRMTVRSGLGRVLWTSEVQHLITSPPAIWEVTGNGALTSRALKAGDRFKLQNPATPWAALWLPVVVEFFFCWLSLFTIFLGCLYIIRKLQSIIGRVQSSNPFARWDHLWAAASTAHSLPVVVGVTVGNVLTSFLLYYVLYGQPVYDTNDDVVMSFIAAGVWNSPSENLVFIHPWFGLLTSALYTHLAGIPWYPVLFIVVIAASMLALNFSVLRLNKRISTIFSSLLATIGTVLPFLAHLQFTMVSGLSMLAGIALWFSFLMKPQAQHKWTISAHAFAVMLCALGMMIRLESALLVATLFIPFMIGALVTAAFSAKRDWRLLFRPMAFPAVLVTLVVTLQVAQSAHYGKSEEWKSWFSLNRDKMEFIDYGRYQYDEYADVYQSARWSKEDYEMLASFQYVDPVRFTPARVAKLVDLLKADERARPPHAFLAGLVKKTGTGILQVWNKLTDEFIYKVHFVIQLMLLCFVVAWNRITLFYFFGLVLCASAIILALEIILNRLPFRVLAVCVIGLTWQMLLLCGHSLSEKWHGCDGFHLSSHLHKKYFREPGSHFLESPTLRKYAACILLVVFSKMSLSMCDHINREQDRIALVHYHHEKIIQNFKSWKTKLPQDAIIYDIADQTGIGMWLPFTPVSKIPTDSYSRCVLAGWPNQTPHQRATLQKLGLQGDFFSALSKKDHVFLVNPTDGVVPMQGGFLALREFYRSHYQLDVKYEQSKEVPNLSRIRFDAIPHLDKNR